MAGRARVGTATVLRIEREHNLPHSHYDTVDKIQRALLEGGVRILEGNGAGAGLQIVAPKEPDERP